MLRSPLVSSVIQIVANCSVAARPRSCKLKRKHRGCRTEPLEVRQLLTGTFEWVQSVGGTSDEFVADIATDETGNIYSVGSFNGSVDFDPGAATANMTSLNSDFDTFITKSNSAGNLIWAKALRGGYCSATSVAIDSQGNLLINGFFSDTVDFDPNAGVAQRTSNGSWDAFVVKLNNAGNLQWVRTFGSVSNDLSNTIAVDSGNSVYLGGYFNNTVDFDPGSGNTNTSTSSGSEGFVLKLNSSGGFEWVRAGIEANASDSVADLAVAGGRVYAIGSNLTQGGAQRLNVLALDSQSGFTVYYRKFSASVSLGLGGIVVNADGSAVVAGNLAPHFTNGELPPSSISFDSIDIAAPDQMNAAFLVKLDANGSTVWAKSMPGLFAEFKAIALASNGDLHVVGDINGSLDADPGPGVSSLGPGAGTRTAFAAVYSATGDLRWARSTSGDDGNSGANTVAVLPNGNTIIAGSYEGTTDFNSVGTAERTAVGLYDTFLWALSPDLRFDFGATLTGDVLLKRNDDRLELWFNGSFTFGQYIFWDSAVLNGVRAVRIADNSSANSVTIDFHAGGGFSVSQGIHFSGLGNNDVLNLTGNGNEGLIYAPGTTAPQTGAISAYGGSISFAPIAQLVAENFQHLSIEPTGSTHVVSISPVSGIAQSVVTGTTGGTAITPLSFDNVRDLTINTGLFDGLVAQSNDSVTFNAGSYEAQGLKNVFVRTGKGNDTLTVNGPDIGLPVDDARFWFIGGAGVDRLAAIGNTNWDLNDTRLMSSGGGKILHDEIEKASITGGAGKNHLNASLFSGDVTLNGGGDNDLIRGGSGNDILYGGTGNDRIYGGLGDDNINGQDGNDQLWGEAGEDTLRGGNNNDWLWGGDDNDWMSGEAGDDILQAGLGDDTLLGGDNNDRLFGDAGNDILNGGTGIDLYDLQGTNNAEDLQLQRVNPTSALFRRKPRGLSSVLEQDTITMDVVDEFLISALGGDDLIAIDLTFAQLGSVDGGDGTDVCTAPAAWTKVSC